VPHTRGKGAAQPLRSSVPSERLSRWPSSGPVLGALKMRPGQPAPLFAHSPAGPGSRRSRREGRTGRGQAGGPAANALVQAQAESAPAPSGDPGRVEAGCRGPGAGQGLGQARGCSIAILATSPAAGGPLAWLATGSGLPVPRLAPARDTLSAAAVDWRGHVHRRAGP
jgi:hypothetical protein